MAPLKVDVWIPCLRYACTDVCIRTIEPKRMFHGNDLSAQRIFCGSGDLNAQRIFRGNGDLKVFEGQRKCDLVKLGRLQQDLVKLVLLRWRVIFFIFFPSVLSFWPSLWLSRSTLQRRSAPARRPKLASFPFFRPFFLAFSFAVPWHTAAPLDARSAL